MTKSLFIGKPVTATNNTNAQIYTKSIIWIDCIPFPSLDKAWQYILGILNDLQQLKIAKEITHHQILSAKKIGYKYKDIDKLLKRD